MSIGKTDYQIGDPVILTNAAGLGKYGFRKNLKGFANSLLVVDDIEYVMFQPFFENKFYYIQADRCVLDIEAKEQQVPIDDIEEE